ncbi:MAG: restriction endonuclease subunit S, partial [Ferruginibacter sp.]
LKEQEQIIRYLDLNLGQINILIADSKNAIQKINDDKQLFLNKMFSFSHEDNFLSVCNILKLIECGLVQAGTTPNRSIRAYYGSEYPLFKPSDFRHKMQLKYAESYLTAKGLKVAGYVSANSLLICTSGINLGNVRITKVDCACSQQMISITLRDSLIPEFVYFQMNTDVFKEHLYNSSKNSIVNISAFKNLSLWAPGLDLQQSIVNELRAEINLLVKKESKIRRKLISLEVTKCNFLLRAFPANLLVKDDVADR